MGIKTLTFDEWRAHWGEARVAEIQEKAKASGARRWEERHEMCSIFPCWELVPSSYWVEDWKMIIRLWKKAGGRCFDGKRLIAAKWNPVWARFGAGFPAGYGTPYPPYALSSCANWRQIEPNEAISLGVITEKEYRDHRDPVVDAEIRDTLDRLGPKFERELLEELSQAAHGLPAGATRFERYAVKKHKRGQSAAECARLYEQQCRERGIVTVTEARRLWRVRIILWLFAAILLAGLIASRFR